MWKNRIDVIASDVIPLGAVALGILNVTDDTRTMRVIQPKYRGADAKFIAH